MLWDLNEGKHLYTLDAGDTINAMCFSPNRYWLCAASGPQVKIWVRHSQSYNTHTDVKTVDSWLIPQSLVMDEQRVISNPLLSLYEAMIM